MENTAQDIIQKPGQLTLKNGKKYDLDFNMASVVYLVEHQGGFKEAIEKLNDAEARQKLKPEYVNVLCDFIIAMTQDNEVPPTSKEILVSINFRNMGKFFNDVIVGISNNMPRFDEDESGNPLEK